MSPLQPTLVREHTGQISPCAPQDPLITPDTRLVLVRGPGLLVDQSALQTLEDHLVLWSRKVDQAVSYSALLCRRRRDDPMNIGSEDPRGKLDERITEVDDCFSGDWPDPDPFTTSISGHSTGSICSVCRRGLRWNSMDTRW